MNTLLDILTGMGLACAVGIRPFLPALVAGALAAADATIDFEGTTFSFLEEPWWLAVMAVALIVAQVLQLRGADPWNGRLASALSGIGIGLGVLLFAAAMDDGSDVWWPGAIGGAVCAAIAGAATRSLMTRTSARLDGAARRALPLYAVAVGVVLAAAAVFAPPVSLVALGFLAFLLKGSGRREGEKYAGLRILR